MYKHILVPVDGSETATRAVEKAAELAKILGSQVTVVFVIDPYPFTGVGADFGFDQAQYQSAATAQANTALELARVQLQTAGVPLQTEVIEGHVVHKGILAAAEHAGADLIVMGSHGRKGIEKLVLGSVTQRVLSTTRLPVLVVRDAVV